MTQRYIDTPDVLPGCCIICGSADRKGFVDTGCYAEFHGAVIICIICGTELASLFGLGPDRTQHLTQKLTDVNEQVYKLRTENRALKEANIALLSGGFQPPDDRSDSVPGPGVLETVSDSRAIFSGGTDDVGLGETRPAGSLHDEGMAELRTSPSRIEFPKSFRL